MKFTAFTRQQDRPFYPAVSKLASGQVMKIKREDLIDGIEVGGAATFLEVAADADYPVYGETESES